MKKEIKVGDKAPDFCLPSQYNDPVNLTDLLNTGPLVIFFYPHDETPICTIEVKGFHDSVDEFSKTSATVVGISADPVPSHRRVSDKHNLPFLLLSDEDNSARDAYGVKATLGIIPGRVTYVVDKTGIVRHIYSGQVNANKHVRDSLAAVQQLM